ncbi:unnamed protein product, partial [marine sediment metagenome]
MENLSFPDLDAKTQKSILFFAFTSLRKNDL